MAIATFGPDVIKRNRLATVRAHRAFAVHRTLRATLTGNNLKIHLAIVQVHLYMGFLALFLGKFERPNERHLTTAGRVGTRYRARPNPCNDSGLAAALFLGYPHFGIEISDAPICLVAHPIAVVLHIGRQPAVARPIADACLFAARRIYRSPTIEEGGGLDHGLVNRYGHGVQVLGMRHQAQALGLKRQRAAAGKRIQKIDGLRAHALHYLGLRSIQHALVVGVLPHHKLFQNVEQPLALALLLRFSGKLLGMGARVIHKRRPNDSTRTCKRTTRPPKMQRGGVAVAD